jgi:hypothetical protein
MCNGFGNSAPYSDYIGAADNEDPGARSGRQFATWVRLGVITRAGEEGLHAVLVVGATSVILFNAAEGRRAGLPNS